MKKNLSAATTANAPLQDLDDLLSVLQQATSLDDLRRRLDSPAERELLKRASLVRTFDEKIFNKVLRSGLPRGEDAWTFGNFILHTSIEPVSRKDGTFRIKERARQDYLKQWQAGVAESSSATSPQQRAFSRKLLDYYEGERTAKPTDLDILALLISVNRKQAAKRFLSLYEKADKDVDLARCYSLLQILEDRYNLLGPELAQLWQQKHQYYSARNLFAADFYQTTTFYERKEVIEKLEPLLKPQSKRWIFHLYASGGLGKTMFLRWFISRYCVPEPRRIPVAKIDFDFVDLSAASRYPWLLLLPITDQLNQQIENRLFNELVADLQPFSPLLRRSSSREQNSLKEEAERRLQTDLEFLETRNTQRFKFALQEANVQKPIVIVMDTLEEMVLSQKQGLMRILEYISSIHEEFPNVRLVLSGRYNLEEPERLAGFDELYGKETEVYELPPFDEKEAEAYLRRKRGLSAADLIRAIIKKSDGNPFKLALFAELALSKEALTVEEIEDYPRADFAYLIERVVLRIQEPAVQWMLRYAVVPRQLTREFFEKVMAPHLRREMLKLQKDRPNEHYPKGAETYQQQEIWQEKLIQKPCQLNLKALWDGLRRYASSYGWIYFDKADDEYPCFQPEVLVPMRQLLQLQKVFKPLHTDAMRYFERKAEAEPERWGDWTAEAIYHRFQRDGAAAVGYWRKKLAAPQARRNPAVYKQLAGEITGRDYVDDEGKPLEREDKKIMVDAKALMEAHCEAAEASIKLAHVQDKERRRDEWRDASTHLSAVKPHGRKKWGRYDQAFLRNLRHLAELMSSPQAGPEVQATAMKRFLRTVKDSQVRLSLELQLADLMTKLKKPQALSHLLCARRVRSSMRYPTLSKSDINLRLARWYETTGTKTDYVAAEREYKRAQKEADPEREAALLRASTNHLANLCLRTGRLAEAEKLANKAEALSGPHDNKDCFQALLLQTRVQLALQDPLEAMRRLEKLKGVAEKLTSRVDSNDLKVNDAAISELNGNILAKLMLFAEALSAFEDAKELWPGIAPSTGIDRARMSGAELQLHTIGNLKGAATILKNWERSKNITRDTLAVYLSLLQVILWWRSGEVKLARSRWNSLRRQQWIRQSPSHLTRVLATGLALRLCDPFADTEQLIRSLEKVQPRSARLPLLSALRYAQEPLQLSAKNSAEHNRLAKIVLKLRKAAHNSSEETRDFIPRAILQADLLRFCGAPAPAQSLLNKAASLCLRRKNAFAYREVLLARDRLHLESPVGHDDIGRSELLKQFQDYTVFSGAALVEQAERAYKQQNLAGCEWSLSAARSLLMTGTIPNQFQARLEEASGRLAMQRAEVKEAELHFNAANALYRRLEDKPSSERVQKLLKERLTQPRLLEERAYVLRINQTASGSLHSNVLVEADFLGKSSKRLYRGSKLNLVRELNADVGDKSFFTLIRAMIKKPTSFARLLGKILFTTREVKEVVRRGRGDKAPDLRLEMSAGPLAKVPWELAHVFDKKSRPLSDYFRCFYRVTAQASLTRENISWLQAALNLLLNKKILVDGSFGSETHHALREAQAEYGLDVDGLFGPRSKAAIKQALQELKKQSPRVLVLQSSFERQRKSMRGLAASGLDWETVYARRGVQVTTLQNVSPETLKAVIRRFNPQVVHIMASLKETSSFGEVYLDFGSDSWTGLSSGSGSSQEFLSAGRLNDILLSQSGESPRPWIILDAQRPPGITETMYQLLLRNMFAAELFQQNNTGSIIATGLARRSEQYRFVQLLADGLAKMKEIGEIVNGIRSLHEGYELGMATESLEMMVSSTCTALFTSDPTLTLVPQQPIDKR